MQNKEEQVHRIAEMLLDEMGTSEQVTPQILVIIKQYPYNTLVIPIVRKLRISGKTHEQIAIRLGISVRSVQWILSKEKNDI